MEVSYYYVTISEKKCGYGYTAQYFSLSFSLCLTNTKKVFYIVVCRGATSPLLFSWPNIRSFCLCDQPPPQQPLLKFLDSLLHSFLAQQVDETDADLS